MQILQLGPDQGWGFGLAAVQSFVQAESRASLAVVGEQGSGAVGSQLAQEQRCYQSSRHSQSEIFPSWAPGLKLDLLLNLGRAVGYFPTCRTQAGQGRKYFTCF